MLLWRIYRELVTKGVCFIQTVPVEYLDKFFNVILGDPVSGSERKRFYFIWGEVKDR